MIFPCPFFSFNAKRKQIARSSPRTGFFPFLLFQEECHKPKVQSATRSDRRETSKHGGNVVHFFLKRIPPPCRSHRAGREGRGRNRKQVKQKEGYHRKGKGKCGVNNRGGEKRSLSAKKFVLSFSLSLSRGSFSGTRPGRSVFLSLFFPSDFFKEKKSKAQFRLVVMCVKLEVFGVSLVVGFGLVRCLFSCGFSVTTEAKNKDEDQGRRRLGPPPPSSFLL